jgi:DNA-binding NarL/FixJ family response regulator
MIRVLVVDDNQEFRSAVRDLLEGDLQIRVVGEACDGLQAISLTAHLQPDLILMDIAMPLMNGLEATSAIRERWPKIIVILVTAIPSNSYQQISDRCGANAFLPKEEMGSRLISTMHRLACAPMPGQAPA